MKKILATLIIALSAGTLTTPVWADGYRGHPSRAYNSHQNRTSDWLGPLIVLGIASAAIGAAANQPSYAPPPQVTYLPPPQPVNTSYYCSSVGQFYPNTSYCPEGWQLVSVR
jgi:hypothetical protein